MSKQIDDNFVDYFNDFYGIGNNALYPEANKTGKNFTKTQLKNALKIRLAKRKSFEFAGDSVDRESLRDIMINLNLINRRY